MYMGDYIVIDHKIGPFEYVCESVSTGTLFNVSVDDDKREIFSDQTFPDQHPTACRFLRPNGNLIHCTIHRDSPSQCKFYRCVIMRIFNETGEVLGTVTGNLSLHSDDPGLRSIWDEEYQKIRESNPGTEGRIQVFLEDRGYRVV
jgi:Fe-S-cluster containining protein